MKIITFTILLFSCINSTTAQNEVYQDKNGAIYFKYTNDVNSDSLKLFTSRSFKLVSYNIYEDNLVLLLKGKYYYLISRFEINKHKKVSG